MKINFEYWIEENLQREATRVLMNEAIICYKNSAYRAALLLSYIAFVDIVRYRLFEAKKPPEISESDWVKKLKALDNDDESEKIVSGILISQDDRYFKLSETIRTQIKYWKDRRNDCAHLKDNCIDASHIESFWLFMRSNLNKINVVGGQSDLISKIKKHFDETYTPYGTDFHYLVKEIPNAIEVSDFKIFLDELSDFFNKLIDENFFYMGDDTRFFYDMLNTLNDRYYDVMKTYIRQSEYLSSEMLQVTPQFLEHYVKDHSDYVREVWKKNLDKANCSKIGCVLLRNSIIPTVEIKEFIEGLIYRNHNNIPKENEITFLNNYGYLEKLKYVLNETLKEKTSFKWWIDKNEKFLEFYIKYIFKNKLKDVVMMIIEGHKTSNNTKGIAYEFFTIEVDGNELNKDFAQECCDELGYKLDDITWVFNW